MTRLNPPDIKKLPQMVIVDDLIELCNCALRTESEVMFADLIAFVSAQIIKSRFTNEFEAEITTRIKAMMKRLAEYHPRFKMTDDALVSILADFERRIQRRKPKSSAV